MERNHTKTAVIVGAGSRIGRTIAVELAKRGFKVGIVDYGVDDARGTLEMVRKAGGTAELYCCDMHNLMEVQAMAEYFFAAWGVVDLVVNNPGVDDCGRCVGDIPVYEWEEVIGTNLLNVVYACHSFIPRMIEQGGGHIANGTYGAGIVLAADHVAYDMARAGVISYTEKLKTELAPCDIGVTMLRPALIDTRIIDAWLQEAGLDVGVKESVRV